MNLSYFRSLLLVFLSTLLFACGGGGGGGGEERELSFVFDACDTVSLAIVNGQSCAGGTSPVVQLNLLNRFGGSIGTCSGVAISSRSVISAAHCFEDGVASVVVLTPEQSIPTNNFQVHPFFFRDEEALAIFSDVAVVNVPERLEVASYPILVSRSLERGEEAVIAGYGTTGVGSSGVLRAGNVFVAEATDDHIFTEFQGVGSNTCIGDSGGPLLVSVDGAFAVAGLVSSGVLESCGTGDTSLYSNLANPSIVSFIANAARGETFQ